MKLLFLVRFWPLLGGVGGYFGVKCGQVGHLFIICGPKWAQVFSSFLLALFGGICHHFQHFLGPCEDFLAHGVPKWSQVTKKMHFRAKV